MLEKDKATDCGLVSRDIMILSPQITQKATRSTAESLKGVEEIRVNKGIWTEGNGEEQISWMAWDRSQRISKVGLIYLI